MLTCKFVVKIRQDNVHNAPNRVPGIQQAHNLQHLVGVEHKGTQDVNFMLVNHLTTRGCSRTPFTSSPRRRNLNLC